MSGVTKVGARPDGNGYYWYSPVDAIKDLRKDPFDLPDRQWQPVKVDGDSVWLIGDNEAMPVEVMPGTFVRAGKPIPFMGTLDVDNGRLIPPGAE